MFSLKFLLFTGLGSIVVEKTIAVPPDACFANFRWDDCGLPAKPVMYYWKPGSRCEVGLWKGCLPNLNMFEDEYECVRTCIFVDRAGPEDYHVIQNIDTTTEEIMTGETETTTGDGSDATGDSDSTGTGTGSTGGDTTADPSGSTPESSGGTPDTNATRDDNDKSPDPQPEPEPEPEPNPEPEPEPEPNPRK